MSNMWQRFAYWPLLFLAPLVILALMYQDTHTALLLTDAGSMTAVMSIIALFMTASLAPVVGDPDLKKCPRWALITIAACFAQLFLALFTRAYWQCSTEAWAVVYVPAIMICLNLTMVILVHTWIAGEGLGLGRGLTIHIGPLTGASMSALTLWLGGTISFGPIPLLAIACLCAATLASWLLSYKERVSTPAPS